MFFATRSLKQKVGNTIPDWTRSWPCFARHVACPQHASQPCVFSNCVTLSWLKKFKQITGKYYHNVSIFQASILTKSSESELLRPWQNNWLVPVTRPTLAQNVLKSPTQYTFWELRQEIKIMGIHKRNVKSWWRYFPNGDMRCRLGVHGVGYRKLLTRICPNFEMLHFIHKNVSRVFSVIVDSPIYRSHDY